MFRRKQKTKTYQDPFDSFSVEFAELKKKAKDLDSEKLKINFFHLIRKFYSKLLHVKYSTTFEEINNEIKNKKNLPYALKQKMIKFNDRITLLEYSPEVIDKNTLYSIIDEFLAILNQFHLHRETTRRNVPQKKKKPSLIKVLLRILHKRATKMDLQKMIIRAYSFLDLDKINEAEKIYNKIKRLYDLLPEQDQREVKGDILNLFIDIKRAKQK
ncbi:MAG: hypothetical protein PWP03_342 [Candidatus Woesearchaeota archaeon]|nr:hypothetical protein [Candidatus Woesearchaeota archaeon]